MTQVERLDMILRELQEYTVANTVSKEAAEAALVREGFYLASGEPAPEFADEGDEA